MPSILSPRLALAPGLFALILAAAVVPTYCHSNEQWDFNVFYSGAQAYQTGQNPYDLRYVSQTVHDTVSLPYVYPPQTLFLWRLFTFFSFPAAAALYLSLKLVAVGVLLFLWNRIFDFSRHPGLFLLLVPFAFNATLLTDLRVGNASVFEQLFIWTGFYCYIRNNLAGFVVGILLASTFKLTPICLLGLLLTRLERRDLIYFGLAGAYFVAQMALNRLLWPQLFSGFLRNVSGLGFERGDINPSTWSLIQDATLRVEQESGHELPLFLPAGIFLVISLVVLSLAMRAFQRLRDSNDRNAGMWRICLTCFLYAVLMPRFKDYSYILLLAPSFYVLLARPAGNVIFPLWVLLPIQTHNKFYVLGPFLAPLCQLQFAYFSLALAWLFGGLCCYSILTQPRFAQSPENQAVALGCHGL